jgi:hypothetical protein
VTHQLAQALALTIDSIPGKSSFIASSQTNTSSAGPKSVVSSLSADGNNLVISFPYVDGSIDKVDYKIDQGKFNLIVIPRPGFDRITQQDLSYSYSGGTADCIIVLGCDQLSAIGALFTQNQALFDSVPVIINIDNHEANQNFGNINIVSPVSLLELVYQTITSLIPSLTPAIATQLYAALNTSTQQLTSTTTTPEHFELAAALMRAGATRSTPTAARPNQRPTTPSPAGARPTNPSRPPTRTPSTPPTPPVRPTTPPSTGVRPTTPVKSPHLTSRQPYRPSTQKAQSPPPPAKHTPAPVTAPTRHEQPSHHEQAIKPPKNWLETLPISDDTSAPTDIEGTKETGSGMHTDQPIRHDDETQTPADWLKPKIMKGSGLI